MEIKSYFIEALKFSYLAKNFAKLKCSFALFGCIYIALSKICLAFLGLLPFIYTLYRIL